MADKYPTIPPVDIPPDLYSYLATKLPDELDEKIDIALAFLFNEPGCEDYSKLLMSLKRQLLLNCHFLCECLTACGQDGLSDDVKEIIDNPNNQYFKAYDASMLEATKMKLNKNIGICTALSQQYLELRFLLVKILLFPDKEYSGEDIEIMQEHFNLDKKPGLQCKTLLNFYLKKEMKDFKANEIWETFNHLIEVLESINREKDAKTLKVFGIKYHPAKVAQS